MKARRIVGALLVVFVALAGMVGAALGADIQRTGSGGDWSNANQWDLNRVPLSSDNVIHGSLASGLLTLDVNNVSPDINDFQAVAGGSRGLLFEEDTTLNIANNFERTGSGTYVTELTLNSALIVDGSIIRGNWIIGTNATIDVNNIELGSGSDTRWEINGGEVRVADTVSVDTGGLFYVNDGGVLTVDGATAKFSRLEVDTGSTADFAGDLRCVPLALSGDLTAGSVNEASSPTIGVNALEIFQGGSMTVVGTLHLKNGPTGHPDFLRYGVGSNTLDVGAFSIEGSNAYMESAGAAASLDLSVAGDFDVATTGASMKPFTPEGVTLTIDGSGDQEFEVFSTDYDVNTVGNVWYGVNKCGDAAIYNARPIAKLIVESGATVDVTDSVINAYRAGGYSQDALYVDGDVIVESGATLDLNSTVLYYTGTLDDDNGNGTIMGTTQAGTKRCYGDFDFDGDVDTADYALFAQVFSGGTPADDALYDADLDTDVDTADFALFAQNFGGANVACPGSCGESSSSGGEMTIEELAEWTLAHLSSAQRESLAQKLYALADSEGETEEAARMAELANLITPD